MAQEVLMQVVVKNAAGSDVTVNLCVDRRRVEFAAKRMVKNGRAMKGLSLSACGLVATGLLPKLEPIAGID